MSKKTRISPVPSPHRARYRSIALIRRNAISQALVVADRIVSLGAAVSSVAFNCIDDAVLDLLANTGVISQAILRTESAFVIPVKEDDHAARWLDRVIHTLISLFKPVHSVDASGVLRDNAVLDISALVSTP